MLTRYKRSCLYSHYNNNNQQFSTQEQQIRHHLMRSLLVIVTLSIAIVAVQSNLTWVNPTADAMVRNGNFAADNYGNEPTTYVKTSNDAGFTRQTYIKFPLTNLAPIGNSKVVIRLFGYFQGTNFPLTVNCFAVNDNGWTENGITWNNRPTVGTLLSTAQVENPIEWSEWDVTAYVLARQNAGRSFASFAFVGANVTTEVMLINSREADVNNPQLAIVPLITTQTTVNPVDDAHVRDGSFANDNYGLEPTMYIKQSTVIGSTRRIYIKFPLSNLSPVGTGRAVVRLFGYFQGTNALTVNCYSVNDNTWTQTTITWNNRPALGVLRATAPIAHPIAWYEWDVTNYVRDRQTAGQTYITFAFVGAFTTNELALINSLESDVNRPQLAVVPTVPVTRTINPVGDATVRDGAYANTNYALEPTTYVRMSNIVGESRRYFVMFPLSNLATVGSSRAVIRLFGYYQGTSLSVNCYSVPDNSWFQSTITWNNQPALGSLLASTVVNHPIAWYEWDVTAYVSSRQMMGQTTISFAFVGASNSDNMMLINSLESDVNRPQLTLIP